MLAAEEAEEAKTHQRRKSDPAWHSKDHSKSHHYQKYKASVEALKNNNLSEMGYTAGGELDQTMSALMIDKPQVEVDEGNRELMSFPLTPTRKRQLEKGINVQTDFERFTDTQRLLRKDQQVGMSQEMTNPLMED